MGNLLCTLWIKTKRSLDWIGLVLFLGTFVFLDFSLAQICKFADCEQIFHREHQKKYRVNHRIYHHSLLPSVSMIDTWGDKVYPIFTNSLGFKDSHTRFILKKSKDYRILFIGDSFTEGIGFNFEDGFVGQINKALAKDGIDVLNAAVSSYSPAVYYSKIRHLLNTEKLDFHHVVVFIDMSDIWDEATWYNVGDDGVVHTVNPEEDHLKKNAFNRKIGNWFKNNFLTAIFIYRFRDWLNYREQNKLLVEANKNPVFSEEVFEKNLGHVLQTRETKWCFEDLDLKKWGAIGAKKAQENMNRLHKLLQRHDKKLTIAIYPWPSNIFYKDYPSRHSDLWNKWAVQQGVDIIDLFPKFINKEDPRKVIQENFILGDVHWNKNGHKIASRAFLEYFRVKK